MTKQHKGFHMDEDLPPCNKAMKCDMCSKEDENLTCYVVCPLGLCNVHICSEHVCYAQPYCKCL